MRFYYDNQRISETVRGRPTIAFVLEVGRKRQRVEQLIGLGKFGDAEYEEEFPCSPRVAALKEKDSPTLGGGVAELHNPYFNFPFGLRAVAIGHLTSVTTAGHIRSWEADSATRTAHY